MGCRRFHRTLRLKRSEVLIPAGGGGGLGWGTWGYDDFHIKRTGGACRKCCKKKTLRGTKTLYDGRD